MASVIEPVIHAKGAGTRDEEPMPRRFTRDEYYKMAEVGILAHDEKVELLDGKIYAMSPIGKLHGNRTDRIAARLLPTAVAQGYLCRVQGPIVLSDFSEPEPDLAIYAENESSDDHPTSTDVLLVIEVMVTSHHHDKIRKLPFYAKHGVRELWLVDAPAGTIEVCVDPNGEDYTSRNVLTGKDVLQPGSLEGFEISVDELLSAPMRKKG